MELTTVAGMVIGFICIIVSIMMNGTLDSFFHLPSIFIVVGGTIAATVVAYPAKKLKALKGVFKNAFQKKDTDLNQQIELITRVANIARREGLLALEDALADIDDPFLKKGIMLIVDGADTELIKSILSTEIYFLQERHAQGQAIISSMATYAPAFGMVGTLIGLINMLRNLNEPDSLGPGMSTALITTFYGVLLANLVFSPIARKLKTQSEYESLQKELLMEGILSIQDGENPRIIRDKLTSFISRRDIKKVENNTQGAVPEIKEIQDEKQEEQT